MAEPTSSSSPPPAASAGTKPRKQWFGLRRSIPFWQSILLGGLCLAMFLAIWWGITWSPTGEGEARLVNYYVLPSPWETFSSLPEVWSRVDGELSLVGNTFVTVRRLVLGFALAIAVGVPLGVAAGCFDYVRAFIAPLVMYGRNIPIAALMALLLVFGLGEQQRLLFIFVACVAFIVSDTAQAIADVPERYVDTAYTLGASRWQIIIKVLFPLALPNVFNSCRLLFGLAFGYIMLTESTKLGDEGFGGLGFQINEFQKRNRAGMYMTLLIIPAIALGIDQILLWVQHKLFPHQYGGDGILNFLVRKIIHAWDDLKRLVYSAPWPPAAIPTRSVSEASPRSDSARPPEKPV